MNGHKDLTERQRNALNVDHLTGINLKKRILYKVNKGSYCICYGK